MQALLNLMRLRQQQDQLRQQTAALDAQKQGDQYQAGATSAAQQQSGLVNTLQALQQDPAFPVPPADIAPVGGAMNDAATLLAKPDTGAPTADAQTDAVNLLDGIIASQARKSGQSATALATMMGMGNSGPGSAAGGTTTHANGQPPRLNGRSRPRPPPRTAGQRHGYRVTARRVSRRYRKLS
jgi:type II secretory pathway pseudopilin PulG